jgi:hypothetical protein
VFEHPVVMALGHLVPAPKQRSECWLVMDSELVGSRMLRLFPTTGLVDLVVGVADASNL